MQLYLDTANLSEIQEGLRTGLVDGITTNPSLAAKEAGDGRAVERLMAIVKAADGRPVSLEVLANDYEGMIRQGCRLREIGNNVVVKVPCTVEGLRATQRLADKSIPVNVTLCFSPGQALLAAKAGATYISPFVGRLDDKGVDGMAVVKEIYDIYEAHGMQAQILVASVRKTEHVIRAATIGADIATMPYAVFKDLFKHDLTETGVARFLADAARVPEYERWLNDGAR